MPDDPQIEARRLPGLIVGIRSYPMSTNERQGGTMKIAIAMADGSFSEHSGAARALLVFHGDRKTRRLGGQDLCGAPEPKPGSLPQRLGQRNVDVLLT
jgi:hypothetical protein